MFIKVYKKYTYAYYLFQYRLKPIISCPDSPITISCIMFDLSFQIVMQLSSVKLISYSHVEVQPLIEVPTLSSGNWPYR